MKTRQKKISLLTCAVLLTGTLMAGCGSSSASSATAASGRSSSQNVSASSAEGSSSVTAASSSASASSESGDAELEDGLYSAEFTTDSSMFHVNEANDDRGLLTVKDGKMTIHVSLVSENIVNLFYGKSEDAKKDGADLIEPTTDTVTYDDGISEEVYGFDIPVPAIDEEFDVALIGTHGNWYDHKVKVSDPLPIDSADELVSVVSGSSASESAVSSSSGN